MFEDNKAIIDSLLFNYIKKHNFLYTIDDLEHSKLDTYLIWVTHHQRHLLSRASRFLPHSLKLRSLGN